MDDEKLALELRCQKLLYGIVLGLPCLGVLGMISYSRDYESYRLLGLSLMTAGAAAMTGGFLGFLFGIPKIRESLAGNDHVQANTNFEQISDWLTKILIGATIVELDKIAALLTGMGNALQQSITGENYGPYFTGITICFGFTGFLVFYLWARLELSLVMKTLEKKLAETESELKKTAGQRDFLQKTRDVTDFLNQQGQLVRRSRSLEGAAGVGQVTELLRALPPEDVGRVYRMAVRYRLYDQRWQKISMVELGWVKAMIEVFQREDKGGQVRKYRYDYDMGTAYMKEIPSNKEKALQCYAAAIEGAFAAEGTEPDPDVRKTLGRYICHWILLEPPMTESDCERKERYVRALAVLPGDFWAEYTRAELDGIIQWLNREAENFEAGRKLADQLGQKRVSIV